jgi:xanthine dehydrogenase YagS FAD-binding subunit
MRPFAYARAQSAGCRVAALAAELRGAAFLAGGTNIVDLIKIDVAQPDMLIDIGRACRSARSTSRPTATVRIGALARMSDTADHAGVPSATRRPCRWR